MGMLAVISLARPSQGGTSTSLPHANGAQPLFLQLFSCTRKSKPRRCRVLLSSEPAFAGRGPCPAIPPWPKPIAYMS